MPTSPPRPHHRFPDPMGMPQFLAISQVLMQTDTHSMGFLGLLSVQQLVGRADG